MQAIQGISDLILVPGLVNLDFADVKTVMKDGGAALMGTGIGRGENRAMDAAQMAISSPLLDNVSIAGARGVLINVTGGDDLTLGDVTQVAEIIQDAVGEDSEIIFGSVKEPSMTGEIRVTVVATGFGKAVPVHGVAGSERTSASKGTPVIPIAGGFVAAPDAPLPDLLSTAVVLHALDTLDVPWRDRRDTVLDFPPRRPTRATSCRFPVA
mgnify:CR=1 FL=1